MSSKFTNYLQRKWKGGMWNEEVFRISVGQYIYFARISREGSHYMLDVGGRKRGCVKISIPKYSNVHQDLNQIAAIRYVHYDPLCSANTDRDLMMGFGTKHMLKTVLAIVKNICPDSEIRFFRFRDASRKKCTDGSIVSLPHFMIALYGKTYYEKGFHAKIENELSWQQYQEAIQRRSLIPKEYMSFDKFVKDLNIPISIASLIEPSYYQATSFIDFFEKLKNAYPDRLCNILQDWIEEFVVTILFQGRDLTDVDWVIPVEKVNDIEVKDWINVNIEKAEPLQIAEIQNRYSGGNHYLGYIVDFE